VLGWAILLAASFIWPAAARSTPAGSFAPKPPPVFKIAAFRQWLLAEAETDARRLAAASG